jgi:hypothetical protein
MGQKTAVTLGVISATFFSSLNYRVQNLSETNWGMRTEQFGKMEDEN